MYSPKIPNEHQNETARLSAGSRKQVQLSSLKDNRQESSEKISLQLRIKDRPTALLDQHNSGCFCGNCIQTKNEGSDQLLKNDKEVIQRTYAPGSPELTGFEHKVAKRRLQDMTKSMKRTNSATLKGNYAMDYSDHDLYLSRSGAHAEQQIADNWDDYFEKHRDDEDRITEIEIYTERKPCDDTCDLMISRDDRFEWTVKYTTGTGADGRSAIYNEVKRDLASGIGVNEDDLSVDDDYSTVNVNSAAVKKAKGRRSGLPKRGKKHHHYESDEEDFHELGNSEDAYEDY